MTEESKSTEQQPKENEQSSKANEKEQQGTEQQSSDSNDQQTTNSEQQTSESEQQSSDKKHCEKAKDAVKKTKEFVNKGVRATKDGFESIGGVEGIKNKSQELADDIKNLHTQENGMGKCLKSLDKATNIKPFLDLFKSGQTIKRTLSIVYRVAAILLGLALLVTWFAAWQVIGELGFFGVLAFIIWQFSFIYAGFLAIKALYIRAREIKDYPDSDYIVVPVIAMLTKTTGEMILIFLAVMSIPAMLLTWCGGVELIHYLNFLGAGNIFLAGLLAFIMSWVIGFIALIVTQLIAEWTLALFSIANDVNMLRRKTLPAQETK